MPADPLVTTDQTLASSGVWARRGEAASTAIRLIASAVRAEAGQLECDGIGFI